MLLLSDLHPLFFATVTLLLTACLGMQYGLVVAALIIATSLIVLFCVDKTKNNNMTVLLCVIVATITLCNMAYQRHTLEKTQQLLHKQSWICSGSLVSKERVDHLPLRYCYRIALTSVENATDQYQIRYNLIVYSSVESDVCVGDTICTTALVCNKPKDTEKHLYLLKNNLVATVFDARARLYNVHRPVLSFTRMLSQLKDRVVASLHSKMSSEIFGLFSSIFLGKNSGHTSAHAKEQFNTWGLAHFLARSGLHLVIFLWLWHLLLGYIPLHVQYKKPLLIAIVTCYWLLSWNSVSFIRALLSWFIGTVGSWMMWPTSRLAVFTATCFIITMINPFVIFFLDFQLSFALTFALIVFSSNRDQRA